MAHVQNISKFYHTAIRRDFARDFQFRINSIADRGEPVVKSNDLVYATTMALPGRTIVNTAQPYMGLEFQIPGAAKYTDTGGYTITFRADGSNIIRSLFERWTFLLFDDQTSTGTYRLYDDSIIEMEQLDQDLNKIGDVYQLHGVFPITVGNIGYDVTGDGAPVTLDVTFAYQYWRKGAGNKLPENNVEQ